jgi:hypothetical protein
MGAFQVSEDADEEHQGRGAEEALRQEVPGNLFIFELALKYAVPQQERVDADEQDQDGDGIDGTDEAGHLSFQYQISTISDSF